jgi:Flp pilus assembly protein TadG
MAVKRSQRGATLVESAITLTVLFAFLFGVFEFGRVFNIYTTLTDAAREGARYSVAPAPGTSTLPATGSGGDTVEGVVCGFLYASNIVSTNQYPCAPATISVNQAASATVNGVTVSYTQVNVSVPYSFFYLPLGSVTLNTTARMRNETN